MKAFSKVTVAANMAFAVAISFFGCSSDDGGDPNTGGGYLSCSNAEKITNQCDNEAKEARSNATVTCGNDIDCLDRVQDDTEAKCFITKGLCDGDANKSAIENKDAIVKCFSHYKDECWNNGGSSSSGTEAGGSSPSGSGQNIIYGDSVTYQNETYPTVIIGTQTWFAKNLNYNVSSSVCVDCTKYGRLYDWSTAMTACPDGWHLPTNADWETLINFAGGEDIAGKKLKATSGWNWNVYEDESGNGTDDLGFAALPGDYVRPDGTFSNIGFGYWWSSTENNANNAYYLYMRYEAEYAELNDFSKSFLYSVRCIKD